MFLKYIVHCVDGIEGCNQDGGGGGSLYCAPPPLIFFYIKKQLKKEKQKYDLNGKIANL